jgi:hypothetical protein
VPFGAPARPVWHDVGVATRLEFWPDYNAGPLWGPGGAPLELSELAAPSGLVDRVRAWNATYADDKLPIDGAGDAVWLNEGVGLLSELRHVLHPDYEVVVTEPWWGEEPEDN